jgi:hypothetical protein
MASTEGEEAGSVGDVEQIGDEHGFTLYGVDEEEICHFAFHTAADARRWQKAMQALVAEAAAIVPAA